MDVINIKSNLYNYSVEFIDGFHNKINDFREKCVYVIDRNVFNLYKKGFQNIDKNMIYDSDPKQQKVLDYDYKLNPGQIQSNQEPWLAETKHRRGKGVCVCRYAVIGLYGDR